MERRRGPVVDGVSRFLSTLAILLGVGGAFFLYQENQTLKEQLELVVGAQVPGNGPQDAESIFQEAEKFNEKWNLQLTTALKDFNDRANDAVRRENEERLRRSEELKKIVDQLRRDRLDQEKTFKSIAELQAFVYAPKLRVARTSGMFGDVDPNFVMIRNEGLGNAEVVSVAFHPLRGGQFETTPAEVRAATDRLKDNQSVVIEFSKTMNRSEERDQGLHRHYERSYRQGEKMFLGNRQVPLSVVIYNSDHKLWGWEGEMEILYSNGRSLFVPSVRAVFVPESTDTI